MGEEQGDDVARGTSRNRDATSRTHMSAISWGRATLLRCSSRLAHSKPSRASQSKSSREARLARLAAVRVFKQAKPVNPLIWPALQS